MALINVLVVRLLLQQQEVANDTWRRLTPIGREAGRSQAATTNKAPTGKLVGALSQFLEQFFVTVSRL